MFGEVEPLKALIEVKSRNEIIRRILAEYPARRLRTHETVYRLRLAPKHPGRPVEYDSPPPQLRTGARLDSPELPVLYASQDLDVCVHECRAAADDQLFVATLRPTQDLRLLDLTAVLKEKVNEFKSLDMAVHMLFLAGPHSYGITREIAVAAEKAGFNGLVYPSYFSLARTDGRPFDTVYGISVRRINPDYAQKQIIPNVAIFGRPVESGLMAVECINRVFLRRVNYDLSFGPATAG